MTLEEEITLVNAVVLTPEQEASIDEAMKYAHDPADEDVAISASFDSSNRMLLLQLKTGQRLAIPQEDLQDIHAADPSELVEVEIEDLGTSLQWEKLDAGMLVEYLRLGHYGNKRWMDGLAQRRRDLLKLAS